MNCHLHILEYFHSELNLKGPKNLIEMAVFNGDLNTVKYLISLNYKVNDESFIKAVKNDHLHILEYFHSELNLKGPKNLIDYAAEEGNLDIIKYLISQNYKVNDESFIKAVKNDHSHILEYFYDELNLRGPDNLIDIAIMYYLSISFN
nr:secreted RxLR effector protein 124-like [Hydra vulgaris]